MKRRGGQQQSFEAPSYTSLTVSKISGVSLRQLQWWDERHIVSPKQKQHRRLYRSDQVLLIALMAELRDKGFPLQKIRGLIRPRNTTKRLTHALHNNGSDLYLLTDGASVYWEENSDRIIDLLKAARLPMFLVCVTDHVQRLARGVT